MTFLTMQQELANRLGALDQSVSSDATKLKRWLNMAQQYICGKMNWPFMIDTEIIQTVTDITTGTASISSGGSTVTLTSGPTASVAGRYIKFSSSDDWYEITAHTASSTSLTVSPTYGQTSNLSGGTYTIRKLFYTTTTPMDSYLDIKKTVSGGQLESLNRREEDFFSSLFLQTGTVTSYVMAPPDSSGNLQFSLINPPSSVINLLVRGIKKLSDLSSDSDTSIIPARWHDAVVQTGAYFGFTALNDNRAASAFTVAEDRIKDMARVFSPDLGRHRVMRAVDDQTNMGPVYQLPSNFGRMYW